MKNSIKTWFGRLGNNIQQISNAIYYFKNNEYNFYCKNHHLIKEFELKFGKDVDISNRFFFYEKHNKDFECDEIELNKSRRNICLKYIKPNLKIPEYKKIPDDTLVIHVRGGDIFIDNPASTYVQNPLSYYTKIIEDFDKVIVIAEDFRNPILNILKQNKKVKINMSTVQEDFATLMSATNLATSGVGTFAPAAVLCSTNIKKLYCTNIFLTEHLNPTMLFDTDVDVKITKINDYIEIGTWKNTQHQRTMMLER